ncbi:MAG: zinc-binding dehydrogenase [Gemmatimonadetes bacterium]|nr:zinc-binding dehydrogenase [Gemmatimonadota bacterium]
MRAAVFSDHGGPEVVRVAEVETPEPGPGEVRVAVRACSVNHLDLWIRRGLPVEAPMPHIGGADIAGVVAVRGPGVEGVSVGTRVVVDPSLTCGRCEGCRRGEPGLCSEYRIIGEHTQGGFAEYAVVPAANLLPLPDSVSFEDAAAAALVFLTAWRGLVSRGAIRAGEDVLITGASGGVGTAAVQIARLAGARVFAVTSGEEKVRRVRELGAEVVYDRLVVDYSRELWRDTGKRGVDLILDSTGPATWEANIRALARGGRLVVYGATTGADATMNVRLLFWKQISIIGTSMSNRGEFETVMRLVFAGKLRPIIDRVLPLAAAREAHELLESGGVFGKLVLVP